MKKSPAIQAPNKILIIRLSSIGDVLLTTPVIRYLKKKFPDSQIDFVVKKQFVDLLKYQLNINHLYLYDKNDEVNSLKKIRGQIREQHYDLIIDLHKNFRSYYLTTGSGAKDIVRYNKGVFQRFLLVKFKLNFYRTIIPIYQRYLNCLNRYEISYDGQELDIFINEETETRVVEKYSDFLNYSPGLTIGIAPGAKHATKQWTVEGFSSVINNFVRNKNARIVLFGSDAEQEIVQSLSIDKSPLVLNVCGKLSLLETAALMNHCDLVLTNDSGLTHLAEALKKKVVAIFGSTTEELGFFPYTTQYTVVQNENLKCRPCSHIGRKKCPKGHFKCMKEISADDDVIKAIEELLHKAPNLDKPEPKIKNLAHGIGMTRN